MHRKANPGRKTPGRGPSGPAGGRDAGKDRLLAALRLLSAARAALDQAENERRLAAELDRAVAGDTVARCTDWQIRPARLDPMAFNDHADRGRAPG